MKQIFTDLLAQADIHVDGDQQERPHTNWSK